MSLVWNPPPEPPERRLTDAQFKGDVQVAAWRQRRDLAAQAHQDPSTLAMSENALAYILMEIESRRQPGTQLRDHLHTAMVKYTPQLAQPTVGGKIEALAHVFAQPEMLDFWHQWHSERSTSARGPSPWDAGAKALLTTLAMSKHTHGVDAYADLMEKPELLRLFARVERAAAARAGAQGDIMRLATYSGSMKRVESLTTRSTFRDLALRTNAELFRGLCELYPDRDFGRGVLIDGCLFPAWCPQVGKGATEEDEAYRRRTTPHAGARLIEYKGTGKVNLDPRTRMSAGAFASSANFDRGYFYVVLLDQASSWPLVSTVMDASFDEADALTALLSDLYRYFPFIEPQFIAGDGAWDESWAHRLCELFYGIAPVFRHTERAAATTTLPGGNQSNTVRGFTHEGKLLCMDHGREMDFSGFDRAPRGDLRPGQGAHGHPDSAAYRRELTQRENAFRVRALHDHPPAPTSRVGLKASLDWRRLNAFPRHPNGKPNLYAERKALGVRLKNQMEGHFNRMQGARLMTDDADRVRLQDWDKVEALLHLAELRMNAISLAAERGHMNVHHALPPDGEPAPPPAFPWGRNGRLAARRPAANGTVRRAPRTPDAPPASRHAVPSALEAPPDPAVDVAIPVSSPAPGRPAHERSAPGTRTPAPPTPAVAQTRAEPAGVPEPARRHDHGAAIIAVDFRNRRRLT